MFQDSQNEAKVDQKDDHKHQRHISTQSNTNFRTRYGSEHTDTQELAQKKKRDSLLSSDPSTINPKKDGYQTQDTFKPRHQHTRTEANVNLESFIPFYINYQNYNSPNPQGSKLFSTNNLFLHTPGLSSVISSSTLRHTSPLYSFPRGSRFPPDNTKNQPANVEIPSTLGKRTTTQGFGRRIVFQFKFQETKANTLPSPDRYELREVPGKDKLKRSFGIPFEHYAKTYIPFNRYVPLDVAKNLPGPGGYNIIKELGSHRYQYQLTGKGKVFNDENDQEQPAPNHYKPQHVITSPSRFNVVSQGIGMKKDPFKSTSTTPGPGRYVLSSPFDKFSSKRNKIAS